MSKEFVLDKVLDKIENKKILKSDDINIKQNENNIRPANNIEDYVTYSNKDISDLGFNVDSIVTGKKCMNKVTSGGVLVSDLKKASSVIEYTNTEKTIGYCFDISDITIRFKNNNFINPFTNKPFSKDFVIQYSDKIRILYKNSSNINVDIDTRKLKLGYLLEKIDENNSVVDKFEFITCSSNAAFNSAALTFSLLNSSFVLARLLFNSSISLLSFLESITNSRRSFSRAVILSCNTL